MRRSATWQLGTIALLVLISCRSVLTPEGNVESPTGMVEPAPTQTQQAAEDLLGRTFVAVTATMNGQARPLVAGVPVEVEFAKEERGEIVRWASCNLSGSLVDIREERLVLLEDDYEIVRTRAGCTDELNEQLEWLISFFLTDPSWMLDGQHLTLSSGDTVIELEQKRS